MQPINILTANNGVGLSRTSAIITLALSEAGFEVEIHPFHERPHKNQRYSINIFLERLIPHWFDTARVNLLIPNQEWFSPNDFPLLKEVHYVLCKTRYAQTLFAAQGCHTDYISFTSCDRWRPEGDRDCNSFLHLAGRSLQKGTTVLIDLWQQHPEWPKLTVVQHPETKLSVTAPNIHYISDYLDDATLQFYQNYCGVHLCPSEAEGFGHYVVEAMSCKALVVTTNAPPMNELVTSDRGLLVNYHATSSQGLGTNYYIDPASLEQTINSILIMDEDAQKQLGEKARAWYLENDHYFQQKLVAVIQTML